MKYYFLKNSTNEKEVGKIWPQCDSIPDGYNYKDLFEGDNSMSQLTNDEFPTNQPNLVFGLHKKAKLTDVISPSNISAIGLLVNEKVKKILEGFDLMCHQFYPASIKRFDQEYKYFWLHLVKPDLLGVNFSQSKFEITNLVNIHLDNIEIENWDHFLIKKMALPMKNINAKKLVVYTEELKDLLYFPYIHNHIFISENLAKELIEKKITGIEISEQVILT